MAKYTIHRWDPIVYGNNIHPFPTIYIKPDKDFIDFVNKNNSNVIVKINGTDTIYDGKKMVGVVKASSSKPTCMPNYFNQTGFYTISLYAQWHGYPQNDKLGVATITGMKGKYKEPNIPQSSPISSSTPFNNTATCCSNNMNTTQIISIMTGILVIFGVLLWIAISTTKKS